MRVELDALRAENFALRSEKIRRAASLPLRLTLPEFASLVRLSDITIRRMVKSRQIEAHGPPYLIPRRELEKFGVSMADAGEAFTLLAAA
ncbi:MAG: helix-turn-helix domain-containing protein [Opitutaceae bacterium]|nr:helix-turn-helix domain-containing protein [Opitutaceae bacterium]